MLPVNRYGGYIGCTLMSTPWSIFDIPFNGGAQLKNTQLHRYGIPFKPRLLSLSLGVASLLLLIIYFLSRMAILSTETAIFAAVGVFAAAAIYESILFSLVTRHMMQKLNNDSGVGIKGKEIDHSLNQGIVPK